MKVIKIDLPKDLAELEIVPMADLHLGDTHCEYKLIQDTIAYVNKQDNRYLILNGDLMDCATKTSIGDVYAQNIQPMQQLEQCVKLFGDLAKKGKILAVLPGNHEARIYKTDGVDMTELMCNQLGISDRYSNTTAFIFVRFGYGYKSLKLNGGPKDKLCYTIYVTHGHGGGRKEGGKVNSLADLASIVDADVYIMSHTHLPVIFKNSFFRVSSAKSTIAKVDKLFVNTNSYLGHGGYGDSFGFKPPNNEQPIIILNGTKKQMRATL